MRDGARPQLRFCDLGPVLLERDGTREPLRGARISTVLGLLLSRANQRVSEDALAEALWGEAVSEVSYTTLDSHLWRVRRLLEPDRRRGEPFSLVVHDAGGYRLTVTTEQVDSLLFERLAGEVRDLMVSGQPDRALLRCDEALQLWRGAPWTPHSDETWAVGPVHRLVEIRAQVREHRIKALLDLGNPESALADLDPLLDAHPMRESLWVMTMLAGYRLGRVDEALETYQRARRTLIDEAGIEPGTELRDLHAQILARDPELNSPAQPQVRRPRATEVYLPSRRTELVGRSKDLSQLSAAVVDQQILSVVGPAGCGKTSLATEVARHTVESFPDGVWFVDLTVASDDGQLLDAITSTLGLAVPEFGSVVEAIRAFTRTRRMLIVLDNCEHLLDPVADLVDAVASQSSELALLMTSREPLVVDGERVWQLEPLAIPSADDDAPKDSPAVQLFLQRLAVAAPQLVIGRHELAQVVEICAAVDGLPLAVELAAGQTRSFTLEEIVDRVRTDPVSLSRVGRRGSPHHATLRGAIELSVSTLGPDELATHRAIAAVPGPFTTGLASALSDLPTGRSQTAVSNLVHRSMLSALGAQRPGQPSRFSQLATIRAQASTMLGCEQRERLEVSRDRWVAALIADMPPIGHPDEAAWVARVDDDLAAVRATLHHCLVEQPDPIGTYVASRLGIYWFYRGMMIEWERWTAIAGASTVADPFDRLGARCSHASGAQFTYAGSLGRAWLDEFDTYSHPLSLEQKVLLVQYLMSIVLVAFSDAPDVGKRGAVKMRALADEIGDDYTALLAEVAQLIAWPADGDPAARLDAVDGVYGRARAARNNYAAWAATQAGLLAALDAGAPAAGLRWADAFVKHLRLVGADAVPPSLLELRGVMLLLGGQPYDALRTLAQSRAKSRRIGQAWPMSPGTMDALAAAEGQLSPHDIKNAYEEGLFA